MAAVHLMFASRCEFPVPAPARGKWTRSGLVCGGPASSSASQGSAGVRAPHAKRRAEEGDARPTTGPGPLGARARQDEAEGPGAWGAVGAAAVDNGGGGGTSNADDSSCRVGTGEEWGGIRAQLEIDLNTLPGGIGYPPTRPSA